MDQERADMHGGHPLRQRKMMAMDLAAHTVSWSVAFLVVGPIVLPERSTAAEIALTLGLIAAGWMVGFFNGLYTGHVGRERTNTTLRTLATLVAVTMLAALFGVAFNLAAKELAAGIALIWVLTVLGRAFINARIRVRRSHGKHHDRIVIIGANNDAAHFIELLELYPELGLEPVGVVGNAAEASINNLESLFCGPLLSATTCIKNLDARFAVVMTGAIPAGRLRGLLEQLQQSDVELMLSADMGQLHQRRLQTRSIGFAPVLLVDEGSERRLMLRAKRYIDVAGSTVALALSAPIQILAAICIKLTDRGPVFYKQPRLGVGGEEFEVLRFRTMKPGTHRMIDGSKLAVWSDPRMTWVGRLLEVTGINEIPQFWNVIRGDMSLVGPKPGYVALDSQADPLMMPPGLTGLWRTEANLYPASMVRHELDDLYVQNWSFRLDVGVLVASIELVMVRLIRGASWRHAHGDVLQVAEAPALPAPTSGSVAVSI